MDLQEYIIESKKRFKTLQQYDLIEKILFTENETRELGYRLRIAIDENYNFYYSIEYDEAISLFLVGCAKYFYNNRQGGFWDSFNSFIGDSVKIKEKFLKSFLRILKMYNLNDFEKEKVQGLTKIGSIVAHSGLPENLETALIYTIVYLKDSSIPFDNLGEYYITQSTYSTESIKTYFNIQQKLGNLNELIYEILQALSNDNFLDEAELLSESLKQRIIEYKQRPKDERTKFSHVVFFNPELFYNVDENQFYIRVPEQNRPYQEDLCWIVKNNDETIKKHIIPEYINEKYYYRASMIKIFPSKKINLFVESDYGDENKQYLLWDETKDKYKLFDENGNYLFKSIIVKCNTYILIDEEYTTCDASYIDTWNGLSLWCFNNKELSSIKFVSTNKDDILIYIKKQVELLCEDVLFSESCLFNGIKGYYSLPKFKLSNIGEWTLSISTEYNKYTKSFISSCDGEIICLDDYIPKNEYGKISIRITNKDAGNKTFKFLYLPECQAYWGNYNISQNGNKRQAIKFQKIDDVRILNTNNQCFNEYEIPENESSFSGIYQYRDNLYHFTFITRSYSWTFENNQKLLGTPNALTSLSIKDLSLNGDCIFTFKNNTMEIVYIVLTNGVDKKPFIVKPHKTKIIDLREYSEFLSSTTTISSISLEQDYKTICDICYIERNIPIKNAQIDRLMNLIVFSWNEDGGKKNRELRCRYVNNPYYYFVIPIPDDETTLTLDGDEERFKHDLIFQIVPKQTKNIFSSNTEDYEELVDCRNCAIFDYDGEEFEPDISFSEYNDENLKKAIYSYLTYKVNREQDYFAKENIQQCLQMLSDFIFKYRTYFGDENIIKALLRYNITPELFEIARKDFGLLFPFLTNIEFTEKEYCKLEECDRFLFVIYAFIKRNSVCLDKILANNFMYLSKFRDSKDSNIMWENPIKTFPNIHNISYYQDKKNELMKKSNTKEMIAYLDVILNEFADHNESNFYKLPENQKTIAQYLENVKALYEHQLIMKIFSILSKRR